MKRYESLTTGNSDYRVTLINSLGNVIHETDVTGLANARKAGRRLMREYKVTNSRQITIRNIRTRKRVDF